MHAVIPPVLYVSVCVTARTPQKKKKMMNTYLLFLSYLRACYLVSTEMFAVDVKPDAAVEGTALNLYTQLIEWQKPGKNGHGATSTFNTQKTKKELKKGHKNIPAPYSPYPYAAIIIYYMVFPPVSHSHSFKFGRERKKKIFYCYFVSSSFSSSLKKNNKEKKGA